MDGVVVNGDIADVGDAGTFNWNNLRRIFGNEIRKQDTYNLSPIYTYIQCIDCYDCPYTALALYFGSFLVHVGVLQAAKKLHNELLSNVVRLPQTYFDTTPTGRIVSRFSGDIDTIDSRMGNFIRSSLITSHRVIATPFFLFSFKVE